MLVCGIVVVEFVVADGEFKWGENPSNICVSTRDRGFCEGRHVGQDKEGTSLSPQSQAYFPLSVDYELSFADAPFLPYAPLLRLICRAARLTTTTPWAVCEGIAG